MGALQKQAQPCRLESRAVRNRYLSNSTKTHIVSQISIKFNDSVHLGLTREVDPTGILTQVKKGDDARGGKKSNHNVNPR